jgi:hypothetical protein
VNDHREQQPAAESQQTPLPSSGGQPAGEAVPPLGANGDGATKEPTTAVLESKPEGTLQSCGQLPSQEVARDS